jgi:predicted pyridoxine 5'-phosphate oxidase superfamily flavin-nucleotide-binding protein
VFEAHFKTESFGCLNREFSLASRARNQAERQQRQRPVQRRWLPVRQWTVQREGYAMGRFTSIAFTPAVKAVQEQMSSRKGYSRFDSTGEQPDALGPDEEAFIAERDSFYMATVSESGWPYVQHRGGPRGFVRVLDKHTLGFADYRGNRQYVSVGNLSKDDRVALIFVDYPAGVRLKVFAHASVVTETDSPEVLAKLSVPDYRARIERGFVLKVEGFDWNCPQHITPRFTEDEVRTIVAPLQTKLAALERENAELRGLKGAGL